MPGRIVLAIVVIAVVGPGLIAAHALHSWVPIVVGPLVVIAFIFSNRAFPQKPRNITPQQLADELEKHLIGSEGQYDWDATTSEPVTDERLEQLISTLPEYDRLETPEKRDRFRQIIETLRRGEIPL